MNEKLNDFTDRPILISIFEIFKLVLNGVAIEFNIPTRHGSLFGGYMDNGYGKAFNKFSWFVLIQGFFDFYSFEV